jgi:hypothetical protein
VTQIIGFDTETHLISQQNQAPRMVCLTLAVPADSDPPVTETDILGNHDWQRMRDTAFAIITDNSMVKVGQNVGYDLTVLCANMPDILPHVINMLIAEKCSDTIIREKLLVLATTGDLDFIDLPDGSKMKAKWGLESLVKKYFGVDLSAEKTDTDSFRLNFNIFDGVPVGEWPEKAKKYAVDDSIYAASIWQLQEEARNKLIAERGIDPFLTESFRVCLDFCLKLMAAWGAATDPMAVAVVECEMAEELKPERLNLLLETGILRPGIPPRPKKGKTHVEGCDKKDCNCPQGMTQGKKESVDTEKLKEYVRALAARLNVCPHCGGTGEEPMGEGRKCDVCKGDKTLPPEEIVMKLRNTKPSNEFPVTDDNPTGGQLSCDAEFLEDYAHLDPVLTQYKHRQELQGIVTRELPRMKLRDGRVAPVVHPQYDCLKSTGRTSSFSSKSPDYASFNCQNVDPRVRQCFVPRPGYLWFSIDYSQMELGTLAQKCFSLFGQSVLREKINAGIDVHAYTGAQLAYALDASFISACAAANVQTRDDIGNVFIPMEKTNEELYKRYRKFAKPVNFGYPGGLGARTFQKFAKVSYDVQVDLETASLFRDLWKETYPEMYHYFDWINKQCIDPYNTRWDNENKKEKTLYQYTSPYGMYRAGCDYCSAANGAAVQTPAAEGALTALIRVVFACHDYTSDGILAPDAQGCTVKPIMFIHDEICGEIRDDQYAHDRLVEVRRIMVESMRIITPDVAVNATPTLMRRWDKDAKPVFDANGRLTVWTPKKKG